MESGCNAGVASAVEAEYSTLHQYNTVTAYIKQHLYTIVVDWNMGQCDEGKLCQVQQQADLLGRKGTGHPGHAGLSAGGCWQAASVLLAWVTAPARLAA